MSNDLDPEEAAALADVARGNGTDDAAARASVVATRDFKEPRTLSAVRIARIEKMLAARLQSIANALAGPLRGYPVLTLGSVGEVNAQGLFDGFVKPFIVHGFECDGQQGWLIWDVPAARRACDTVLSGDDDSSKASVADADALLSRTERRVVASLLDEIISRISSQFGLEASKGSVWQEPEEVTTMEDLGPDADSRRLHVHLGFRDPAGNASDLRVYFPGIIARDEADGAADHAAAPQHLSGVSMQLSAILGGADVPLEDLLQLELGDVIPLDVRLGDPVVLEIEETVCARGRFGAHRGLLAVLVDEIGPTNQSASPNAASN